MHRALIRTAVAALGLAVAVSASPCFGADRPALVQQQGHYFRWMQPQGWRANETTNGVDLFAPDGITTASWSFLVRGQGAMTPQQFFGFFINNAPVPIRVLSTRDLPSQPTGYMGTMWRLQEFETAATLNGAPARGDCTVGISSFYGTYSAVMLCYSAPAAQWNNARLWLPEVARTVTITNPAEVAGNNTIIPPRNNPADDSALMESWRNRRISQDRIAKEQREATSGYERLRDPETGTMYELPLEAWDATRGGYVNPKRPTELLERVGPGE